MEKSRKRRGKSAAVVAIAVAAGILCGLILYVLPAAVEPGVVGVVMVLYALVVLAVLAGVIYVAVQRLREIQSGEEDEASQY